ncbi:MAG: hypothetical protein AAGD14_14785 [Planctomycetota bacterium]
MRTLGLALLLLGGGCAQTVTVDDVQRSFQAEEPTLHPELPRAEDFRALRFRGEAPMARTIELAEQFLAADRGAAIDRSHVRALLCCGYLLQQRVDEARPLARELVEPGPNAPKLQRAVIAQAKLLYGAMRALEALRAVDALVAANDGAVDFVEEYGPLVGYPLPRKHQRDYLVFLERYVLDLQRTIFPPEPRSPTQLEARTRRIREMKRSAAELVYNDAAALLQNARRLPRAELDASDRFFATAIASLYVTLSYLSDDLVPRVRMEPAQKQWLREQALSTYDTALEVGRRLVEPGAAEALRTGLLPEPDATPADGRARLYARLDIAQKEVLAWITIR